MTIYTVKQALYRPITFEKNDMCMSNKFNSLMKFITHVPVTYIPVRSFYFVKTPQIVSPVSENSLPATSP